MKSIRLNISIRDDMISKIRDAFTEKNPRPFTELQIKLKESAIAVKIYNRFMGKYQEQVKGLPTGLVNISDSFAVAVAQGGIVRMKIYDEKGDPVKQAYLRNGSYNQFPIGQISRVQWKEWRNAGKAESKANDEWESKLDQLLDEARQILDSVTTTKQLKEVWPEGCSYLPPYAADPSVGIANFPALTTSRLNEALGISE